MAGRLAGCPGHGKTRHVEPCQGEDPLGLRFHDPALGPGRLHDGPYLVQVLQHGLFPFSALTISTAPSMEGDTGTPLSSNPSMSMSYLSTCGT